MTAPTDLTLGEAARRLGLSYRHVRRLVDQGRIKARIVGHTAAGPRWRVTAQAVGAYRRRLRRKTAR